MRVLVFIALRHLQIFIRRTTRYFNMHNIQMYVYAFQIYVQVYNNIIAFGRRTDFSNKSHTCCVQHT